MVNIPRQHPCAEALQRARVTAQQVLNGVITPVAGAESIAGDAFPACYDWLNTDVREIDFVSALASLVDDCETPGRTREELVDIETEIVASMRGLVGVRGGGESS
jgi:hypothetical protein